ncbi:MAG: hypothetical protein K6T83_15645 [Alicyclobacillus sp.]|nr:hypothetical protein [Alicyclobacillus sp.]
MSIRRRLLPALSATTVCLSLCGMLFCDMPQVKANAVMQPMRDPDFRYAAPAHRIDIRSSVQVSREALREAYTASRDAYTQKLKKYAKCSPKEAEKAVAAAHPGMTIDTVQLRNIRTNLVYMGIVEDNEDKYLVIVDAGNGKVLLDRPLPSHHERVFAEHG